MYLTVIFGSVRHLIGTGRPVHPYFQPMSLAAEIAQMCRSVSRRSVSCRVELIEFQLTQDGPRESSHTGISHRTSQCNPGAGVGRCWRMAYTPIMCESLR